MSTTDKTKVMDHLTVGKWTDVKGTIDILLVNQNVKAAITSKMKTKSDSHLVIQTNF